MADTNQKQPVTVMVKKPDGTFERKTLEEVTGRKSAAPKVAPASLRAALLGGEKKTETMEPTLTSQKTTPDPRQAAASLTAGQDSQAEGIVRKLTFTVPSTATNRLRTLIQLRLKDIRSPEQVHEALLRRETDGGVGLTDKQAEEVMGELPGWLPMVKKEAPFPATTTPNNAFKHATTPAAPVKAQAVPTSTPVPVTPIIPVSKPVIPENKQKVIDTFIKNNPEEPYFKLTQEPKSRPNKPHMQDITSKPISMGPTDEIRYFTLTDFRRLANNPEESVMRFKQKFMNLKDESVLLYMDAVDAWKKSPLYAEYMHAVLASIAQKQPLSTLVDQKTIMMSEITAILKMEQQLIYV